MKQPIYMYPKVKKLKTASMDEIMNSFQEDVEEPFKQYHSKIVGRKEEI